MRCSGPGAACTRPGGEKELVHLGTWEFGLAGSAGQTGNVEGWAGLCGPGPVVVWTSSWGVDS